MVHPRSQTLHGESVAKPGTLPLIILSSVFGIHRQIQGRRWGRYAWATHRVGSPRLSSHNKVDSIGWIWGGPHCGGPLLQAHHQAIQMHNERVQRYTLGRFFSDTSIWCFNSICMIFGRYVNVVVSISGKLRLWTVSVEVVSDWTCNCFEMNVKTSWNRFKNIWLA